MSNLQEIHGDSAREARQRLMACMRDMQMEGYDLDVILDGFALLKWEAVETGISENLDPVVRDALLDDAVARGYPARPSVKPSRVREFAVTYLACTAAVDAIVNVERATHKDDTLSDRLAWLVERIDAKRDRAIIQLADTVPADLEELRLRKEALLNYCARIDDPRLISIASQDCERILALEELMLSGRQSWAETENSAGE